MLCLTTHQVGSCRAIGWAAGTGGPLPVSFPALVTLIRLEGFTLLVDCGYGPAFFEATAGFPARIYRWLTPVSLPGSQRLNRQLPCQPDLVMLTHLHADHVAGLCDLPAHVPVAVSASAMAHLPGLSDLAATRAACPPRLRDMILSRPLSMIENQPLRDTGLPGFPSGHDLLGDGRLLAVPLPGHGVGQMGLWIPEAARLLIADAAYSRRALRLNRMPPHAVLSGLGDATAYAQTFTALRRLMLLRPDIRLDPSHCPEVAPCSSPPS